MYCMESSLNYCLSDNDLPIFSINCIYACMNLQIWRLQKYHTYIHTYNNVEHYPNLGFKLYAYLEIPDSIMFYFQLETFTCMQFKLTYIIIQNIEDKCVLYNINEVASYITCLQEYHGPRPYTKRCKTTTRLISSRTNYRIRSKPTATHHCAESSCNVSPEYTHMYILVMPPD